MPSRTPIAAATVPRRLTRASRACDRPAWNYGRDDRSDLAIGAPFEDLPSGGITQSNAGAVIVIYGTAAGLTATAANPAQLWHQDVSGVNDVLQQGDRFGHSLY